MAPNHKAPSLSLSRSPAQFEQDQMARKSKSTLAHSALNRRTHKHSLSCNNFSGRPFLPLQLPVGIWANERRASGERAARRRGLVVDWDCCWAVLVSGGRVWPWGAAGSVRAALRRALDAARPAEQRALRMSQKRAQQLGARLSKLHLHLSLAVREHSGAPAAVLHEQSARQPIELVDEAREQRRPVLPLLCGRPRNWAPERVYDEHKERKKQKKKRRKHEKKSASGKSRAAHANEIHFRFQVG